MTVNKARKLLGSKYKDFSNKEVEQYIINLRGFSSALVEAVLNNSNTMETNVKSTSPS